MKFKFYPTRANDGKPRNATRKFLNERVSSEKVSEVVLRITPGSRDVLHGEITLQDGSRFMVSETTASEARVLTTGIFRAQEGSSNDAASDL